MAFVKKTWKNRVSEFFNRYRVENVQTGAISKVYMNLDDGVVTQEGDVIDANTMNDLEDRIEDGFNETYKSTDGVETSIDNADFIPFYDSSAQAMKKIAVSDAEFGGGGAEVYIAGVESTSTASQAYVIGQYLVYNGYLYKVISAIAQGDVLVIGTNIQLTTVGNEITNANTAITNANTAMNRIRTYVGSDSKLHFTDATGADSVLPFSSTQTVRFTLSSQGSLYSQDHSGNGTIGSDGTITFNNVKSYKVVSGNVNVSGSGGTYTFKVSVSYWGYVENKGQTTYSPRNSAVVDITFGS